MYSVQDFFDQHGKNLRLEILSGKSGMQRLIQVPEVQRPGLSLTGYLRHFASKRILIFGKVEIFFLRDLDEDTRVRRLQGILKKDTPAVIVSRSYHPPKEMLAICEEKGIPLLRAPMTTMDLVSKMTFLLTEEFAPSTTCHGTLVEAFGVGVMIQGNSSVGKSEAALGLIERGHRLISDDVVRIKVREGSYLEGSGPELTRHLMEIRGIGIINVAHLYGAVCVRDVKSLDLVVKLEEWDDRHFYDRVGLDEKFCDILGVNIPYHILPLKPGRDVVLLLETIALNHRLKEMGYHSAKEFNVKLLETIANRQKQGKKVREASQKVKN